jgi:hypothetical protein
LTAALAVVALSLAGCGLGGGKAPSGVTLTVTDAFGSRVLEQARAPNVVGQETVMELLMRNDHVQTRYGGGFVQSINGLAGGERNGRPDAWFYYVNGIEAPAGAAETKLHAGDSVWWDRHDWGLTDDVPAVVGSYPEPFLHGTDGKRLPITVYCPAPSSQACKTVSKRLSALGVPITFGALGTDEPETLRVLVGTWLSLRTDPAASYLQQSTQTSGVYARFAPDGRTLALLDPEGHTVRTLAGGTGVVAADRIPNEVPTWLITGTDSAGVDAAAHALDQASLDDHFAVALSAGRVIALPVAGAA